MQENGLLAAAAAVARKVAVKVLVRDNQQLDHFGPNGSQYQQSGQHLSKSSPIPLFSGSNALQANQTPILKHFAGIYNNNNNNNELPKSQYKHLLQESYNQMSHHHAMLQSLYGQHLNGYPTLPLSYFYYPSNPFFNSPTLSAINEMSRDEDEADIQKELQEIAKRKFTDVQMKNDSEYKNKDNLDYVKKKKREYFDKHCDDKSKTETKERMSFDDCKSNSSIASSCNDIEIEN